MIWKDRLVATGLIVMAVAMVTASGAFTSVEANRNAAVVVADDERAYLGLSAHEGPNGAFADDSGVSLELRLDGSGSFPLGDGLNPDATTHIDNVFNITNQGTQTVTVWVNDSSSDVDFHTHDSSPGDLETKGTVALSPGETVQVGIEIDTSGYSSGNTLLETVVVAAEKTDASSTV